MGRVVDWIALLIALLTGVNSAHGGNGQAGGRALNLSRIPVSPSRAGSHASNPDRNLLGPTYGTAMTRKQQLAEPEVRPSDAQLPDLVGVVMADGREGYVYKTDLLQAGTPASSPKEGLARTGQRRVLTVYAQDGFTVLGVFMVGPTPTGRD